MNKVYLFLLIVLGVSLIACGGDDDSLPTGCADADFIGLWDGSIECDSSTVNAVTIEFFDEAGVLSTRYVGNEFPATRTDCSLSSFGDFGGYSFDVQCELDGNEMTMETIELSVLGDDRCSATLRKR